MSIKFKLLIQNPELESNNYQGLNSDYLTNTLSSNFYLPIVKDKPFIFSCFALSVDGKLCYPDLPSGFAIAKENLLASQEERDADWFSLLLARAISDAVIIGRNSLQHEHYDYSAKIDIAELSKLRKSLNKPDNLLHIVITRYCENIDFEQELLTQNNDITVIIFCEKSPIKMHPNFKIKSIAEINLTDLKQIVTTENFYLQNLIDKLFTLGIKTFLNESPYYHHVLQEQQLLNEAWLNTSSIYIGGQVTALGINNNSFSSKNHPHYTILSLHNIGYNFLYTRYQVSY